MLRHLRTVGDVLSKNNYVEVELMIMQGMMRVRAEEASRATPI